MPRSTSPPRLDFDYYIAPDGLVYSFDDAGGGRWLYSFTGDGMPDIEYRTQRGPFQHGETLIDYVLRPRVIQYVHRRQGHSRSDYWDLRADILNNLRPNRQLAGQLDPGQLRKVLANGDLRDIDVLIQQGPAFEPRQPEQMDEFGVTEVLRFIAHDPVFYDPTQRTAMFAVAAYPHLVFPVQLVDGLPGNEDMVFGLSVVNNTINLAYLGTWLSYPVIEITGPAQQPIITNLTTGEFISLNYFVPAGRVVTIDLAYGRKTVEDDLGTNLIGTVTPDSDLATWHIAPDPEAPGGINQINVYFASATPASQVVLRYYDRFIGI